MIFTWHATNAPGAERYDDFHFIDPQVGWAINSDGQIIHTDDGFKTAIQDETGIKPPWSAESFSDLSNAVVDHHHALPPFASFSARNRA